MLFLLLKKEKIKISYISLLYCHCHFVLSAKGAVIKNTTDWDGRDYVGA